MHFLFMKSYISASNPIHVRFGLVSPICSCGRVTFSRLNTVFIVETVSLCQLVVKTAGTVVLRKEAQEVEEGVGLKRAGANMNFSEK